MFTMKRLKLVENKFKWFKIGYSNQQQQNNQQQTTHAFIITTKANLIFINQYYIKIATLF